MKILQHFLWMAVLSLFLTTTASAQQSSDDLYQKAWTLTVAACGIYPAIRNETACVDTVIRKVLSDRGVAQSRQEEILLELDAFVLSKTPSASQMPQEQIVTWKHALKLMAGVTTMCVLPPEISDLDVCMDKAYHSILSSRDPHSSYMSKEEAEAFRKNQAGDLQGIGANIAWSEAKAVGIVRVMEGSPAERAGILDGDRIVVIINGSERVLVSDLYPNMEAAVKKVSGKPNTSVTFEILRGEKDKRLTITVVRAAIKVPQVKTEILVAPDQPALKYSYVKLTQFGYDLNAQMRDAIKILLRKNPNRGFVFDLRGNPGGSLGEVYMAVDSLSESSDPLVSIRNNEGIHAYGTAHNEAMPRPQPGDITGGLPCVVLVNGTSASAAEIFSGSLKALGRCVIIGKRTWGKGSMQQFGPYGDGSYLKLNEGEYLLGSPTKWVAVQCIGVIPDIAYDADVANGFDVETHECDDSDAIVSGGASSHPGMVQEPLATRNPDLYRYGLAALEAVKVIDQREALKLEQVMKLLRIKKRSDMGPGE